MRALWGADHATPTTLTSFPRVYREEEQHSSVYRSTSINTSRQLMSFSDFPMPRSCVYPTHGEIVRYFESYSDHFGVRGLIRFQHVVERVEKGRGGGYTLRVRDKEGQVREQDFDAVMVSPAPGSGALTTRTSRSR